MRWYGAAEFIYYCYKMSSAPFSTVSRTSPDVSESRDDQSISLTLSAVPLIPESCGDGISLPIEPSTSAAPAAVVAGSQDVPRDGRQLPPSHKSTAMVVDLALWASRTI